MMNKKNIGAMLFLTIFLLTGCADVANNDTTNVTNVSSVSIDNNDENKTSDDIANHIYEKLSDSDKKQIVSLQDAIVEKIVLENDIGIQKTSESIPIINGMEVFKVSYETSNETLGDFIVYANTNDLSILGYGLRD